MHFSNSALFMAASLLAITNALPVESYDGDCPAGKVFYSCANGFRGCCSADACTPSTGCPDKPISSAPIPSPSSTSPVISAPARPVNSPPTATCVPGTKGFKQFNPTLRTIGQSTTDSSLFHLSNDNATNSHAEQVFTFVNIPSTAKNIILWWGISTSAPQFTTKGGATSSVYLLDANKLDSSAAILTAAAVNAAIESTPELPGGSAGGASFGMWDGPDFSRPQDHLVSSSPLPTRSTLVLKIGLEDQSDVVIRQTAQDGLYLKYDC